MLRAIATIAAGLQLAQPMTDTSAMRIAEHLSALAVEHSIDPLTLVAMGWHESRWLPASKLVRGDEEYVGVFQIRLRNFDDCQGSLLTGPCDTVRRSLEDWRYNATTAARYITINRGYCHDTIGSARLPEWLASFGGFNRIARPGRVTPGDRACGREATRRGWRTLPLAKAVVSVIEFRAGLIRRLTDE